MRAIDDETIAYFADMKKGWDSYGAAAPSAAVLATLKAMWLVPTCDGGMQIEWHCNGVDVEIEIDPNGVGVLCSWDRADPLAAPSDPQEQP